MNDLAMKDEVMKDEKTLSDSPSPLLASPSSPYCGKRLPKAGEDYNWGRGGKTLFLAFCVLGLLLELGDVGLFDRGE